MFFQKKQFCLTCGHIGKPKNKVKGSAAIELFLYLLFIIPGLIYSAWRSSNPVKICEKCGSDSLVPESARYAVLNQRSRNV